MSKYETHYSDEPLRVIEANECSGGQRSSLITQRFRRLFNEIESLRAANKSLSDALERLVRTHDSDHPAWVNARAALKATPS